MTQQSRLRRMGWIAVLALCTVLYLGLHLKVHAVRSEVVSAERQIVALENQKILLATEFETRASQQQLASWNRVALTNSDSCPAPVAARCTTWGKSRMRSWLVTLYIASVRRCPTE